MRNIDFYENKPTPPTFTMELSLVEAIELYKLFNTANNKGIPTAKKFESLMNEFAANSNDYTQYLDQ